MTDETPETTLDDVELPLPARRRDPRPAGPGRAREITNAITAITVALLGLIFHPDVMSLIPPLLPAQFWVLLVVFHLAALDVVVRSIRGQHLWTPTVMIVCVGGGVTIVAIALAYLSGLLA